jgi:hypothetical protein
MNVLSDLSAGLLPISFELLAMPISMTASPLLDAV